MTSRHEKERAKQIQEKCQNLLTQMLRDEDNKYCVDCDAKGSSDNGRECTITSTCVFFLYFLSVERFSQNIKRFVLRV